MKLESSKLGAAPRFTPPFVTEALGPLLTDRGRSLFSLSADPSFSFSSIVTDSRKIEPNCLFVAIAGEKFDGHDFISDALKTGARGIIYQRDRAVPEDDKIHWFPVEDTQQAYRALGAAWRRQFSIPIVAVAGSVGKTTTKELLAAILTGKWDQLIKTQGSQNGFLGIPMTLLEIRPQHSAAVVEVGIDEEGAMEKHLDLVAPKASVLTAICEEHLEKLHDLPTVAREEGLALSRVARANGTIAINLDDPWIRPFAVTLRDGKKICFSLDGTPLPERSNGCTEKDVVRGVLGADGRSLTVQAHGWSSFSLHMPLFGAHNARNLLGALAIAKSLGLTEQEVQEGLRTFRNAGGRSEIADLPDGTVVLCDYYNANPTSMVAGFELLSQLARRETGQRTRWACIGDMLELGPNEHELHGKLAESICKLGIEHVLLYGPRMRFLLDGLKKADFAGSVAHFSSHGDLAHALLEKLQPGDAVLIKGSRGMKMEEVWKIVKERRGS